jgi:hypothetical protein
MNLRKLLCIALAMAGMTADGQTLFPTRDSVTANKISATVLVHGDLWWEGGAPGHKPMCTYPAGTAKNVNFVGALWMSGYDASNQLHVSAQTYRQDGMDYWPGPLDAGDTLEYATSNKWAKIWKVERSEIDAFKAISTHTIANTPSAILTWPAKGNAYALGKGGFALTIDEDMAPFIDLNFNGIYEPLQGDYPNIYKSEQALWWCFSDNGATHNGANNGKTLKMQVHAMSYAYKRNTLMDQVVYYDYTLVNKSDENYHDVRLALWNDMDIGYFLDDYLGFDSTWRMRINYNGHPDDGIGAGHPDNSYGTNIPATGVTMIVTPGDVETAPLPLGSFMYYWNDMSSNGNPTVDTEYNNYMHAKKRNGEHLQYSGVDRNYAYPDDATVVGAWNECTLANPLGDRRAILSTGDFNFNAGQRKKLVMALLVDTAFGGCPTIASYDTLRMLADTAWRNYHATHVGVRDVGAASSVLSVYPNPANDVLYVDASARAVQNTSVVIYNSIGQRVMQQSLNSGVTGVDIQQLVPGAYIVICQDEDMRYRAVFMKR